MISAFKYKSPAIDSYRSKNAYVWFHIHCDSGREARDFLTDELLGMDEYSDTVLFPSGCEWLVCSKVKDEKGVTHVYLRQLELAISSSK